MQFNSDIINTGAVVFDVLEIPFPLKLLFFLASEILFYALCGVGA